MDRLFFSIIFALILSGLSGAAYGEEAPGEELPYEPCVVQAINGGVGCVQVDGRAEWLIEHPSLWDEVESYLAGEEERFVVGPVVVGERTFYGVRGDLLELDVEVGAVVGRRRFPAPIVSLELLEENANQLAVVIHFTESSLMGVDEKIEIMQYLNGPGPSQNVWAGDEMVPVSQSARNDADWLMERGRGLVEAAERDRVNFFLLGHLEEELEGGAGAERWEKALEVQRIGGAAWMDALAVSWRLEAREETRELAGKVYEAALEQMAASEISPARMANLVKHVFRNMDALEVIRDALERGEVERVEILSERIVTISPLVEGGEYVWVDLANWLESQGRDGEKWRAWAEINRGESIALAGEDARRIDQLIPIAVGLLLALLLYPFLIGLRGGRGAKRWVPEMGVRDILGVVLLLGALLGVNYMISSHVKVIGHLATAPINLADDTLAAPDVEMWLEGLAESTARDRLLEMAAEEREVLEVGMATSQRQRELHKEGSVVEKIPVSALVHEAIMADARAGQWESLKRGKLADPFALASLDGDGGLQDLEMFSVLRLTPFLLLLALILMVGGLVGRFVPVVGLWGPRLVPGGASLLAPLGGLLLAGFIAGWAAILGFDQILSSLTGPSFGRYFGLEGMAGWELMEPGRWWAWGCIVGALVVQGVAVGVELLGVRRLK